MKRNAVETVCSLTPQPPLLEERGRHQGCRLKSSRPWERGFRGEALSVIFALLLLLSFTSVTAQTTSVYQAFVMNGPLDRLTFIDVLTGAQTTFDLDGDRYTLINGGVLFFDRTTNRVRTAAPSGTLRDHPFVQLSGDARRIDWALSGDQIVWTLTSGATPTLTTTTYAANLDGSNERQVFADSNGEGVRAFPVAVNGTTAYMDFQPDNIGDITPFRQYAGLFALDLATGATAMLPGEPGCFCGGGIGAGRLIRLALAPDLAGFDVHVIDLTLGSEHIIPSLGTFTQGGDVVIDPGGRYAAYALGEIRDLGLPTQSVRTVVALLDLATMTQRTLVSAPDRQLRPLQFSEGALLLGDQLANETLKADLSTGDLETVAQAVFLGTVQNS